MPRRRLPLTGDNRIDAHLPARALGNEPRASMMTRSGGIRGGAATPPRARQPPHPLLLPPARRSYEFNECWGKERVEKIWRGKKNTADVWLGERVTESGAVFKGLSSSPISYNVAVCTKWRSKNEMLVVEGGGEKNKKNNNRRSLNTQWSKNENKFPASRARLAVFSPPKHQEKSSKPTLLRATFQKGLR